MKTNAIRTMLVLALLLGVFSLTGCGGDTSSPEAAVTAYHEALENKDKERMKSVLSKEDLEGMKELDDSEMKADDDMGGDYAVGTATVNGDNATVDVTYTKEGEDPQTMKYHCVKEDGEWKVAMGKTFAELMKEAFKDMDLGDGDDSE